MTRHRVLAVVLFMTVSFGLDHCPSEDHLDSSGHLVGNSCLACSGDKQLPLQLTLSVYLSRRQVYLTYQVPSPTAALNIPLPSTIVSVIMPDQELPPMPQEQQEQAHRIAYAAHMRKLFSPPGMLNTDGSINQEFFRPKKVLMLTDKKWGEGEREQLYIGLQKYGVGKWRDIGEDLLHGWDDHSIRIKAAKILGCQNLSWYYGRRFTKEEVQAEYERNKQLGAETGCWKNGMLVDNDQGTLKAHFQALAAAAVAEQEQQPPSSVADHQQQQQ